MTRPLILLLMLAGLLACIPISSRAEDSEKLLKIVALSRHGVRAPTQSDKVLALWSQKLWPSWPVKKGDLTPRGAALTRAMWMDMRDRLASQGLLPEAACPSSEAIHIRADTDERTRATAAAMLEGLAPDCHLGYQVADVELDPLFHPVKAGLYHFDAIPTVTNVLAMADGSLGELQDDYMGAINLLGRIAGPPASSLCVRYAETSDCNLADLPNAVSISSDGRDIQLLGALSVASSMAEIFLLEYAEWPRGPAGWGQVNGTILSQILPVHSRVFDVVNRAGIVAKARGSALLREMGDAVSGSHADKKVNDAKIVIFVGHDTNIANLGALMGANWHVPGFPENGIPPASLLSMELWSKNGGHEVRLRYYAQTLHALHTELPKAHLENEGAKVELADFAPVCLPVNVPPVVGEARFTLAEFSSLIARATKDGPIVPPQKTSEVFGMPAVSQ